jgi:hypothetical protein
LPHTPVAPALVIVQLIWALPVVLVTVPVPVPPALLTRNSSARIVAVIVVGPVMSALQAWNAHSDRLVGLVCLERELDQRVVRDRGGASPVVHRHALAIVHERWRAKRCARHLVDGAEPFPAATIVTG